MGQFGEAGRIGQKRYSGRFSEEFLRELQGKKGIETYREMSENDDVIGAILFAIEMLIRQASFTIQPMGDTPKDVEAAEFIDSCMYDMQETWTDTISEILSFLTYGWSFHEIVYKRRMGHTKNPETDSKHDDGLIGWRKMPIRAQETLYEWIYDDNDNLLGMKQQPPPLYGIYEIPLEKALLFRTKSRKNNPEGRSVLRNAYRSWYFKRRIQEYEGIGIERDLAGLPVFIAPEGVNIWDDEDEDMQKLRASMETLVKGIRQDEIAGIAMPAGFDFKLVNSAGSKQFDTNAIIGRYDRAMAMTVLADFIFLGHEQTGSFALSSDKTELFSCALGAYLDIICETFNRQAIPKLIDLNGAHFSGITDYPEMIHGDVEDVDIQKIGEYLKSMTGIGLIVPDDGLEDFVREVAHLPERTIDTREMNQSRADVKEKPEDTVDETPPEEPTEEEMQAAKKRLGRLI